MFPVISPLSEFFETRMSDTSISCLPMSDSNPKSLPSALRDGLVQLSLPSIAVNTRPMVPLPLRGGPTIKKIFC